MQKQTVYVNQAVEVSDPKQIKHFVKMLSFTLASETYCIDVNDIREMIDVGHITKVPHMPDFVVGAMNVRGEITTILDIKKLIGLELVVESSSPKIILTDIIGSLVGILADSINGTINIEQSSIQPVPGCIDSNLPGYIKGQVKLNNKLLIVLNIKSVLSSEKIKMLEEQGNASQIVY